MKCQVHGNRIICYKCHNCEKYLCSECKNEHEGKKHSIRTLVELSKMAQITMQEEISKINHKIEELSYLGQYEIGESIIESCLSEIMKFIHNLFEELKQEYRKITDQCWENDNKSFIHELEEKKASLRGWVQILKKNNEKFMQFEEESILEQNRLECDDYLLEDSASHHNSPTSCPKLQFNQIALKKAHQALTKIIYINRNSQTNPTNLKPIKVLKRSPSKRSNKSNGHARLSSYTSLCKFVEGTPILYEYILFDPQNQQNPNDHHLKKIEFRQFITPMRSVSISQGSNIYLIGGENKERKASKQIWLYERAYNTMRIIGLLKQARVGHSVCSDSGNIYVFGGKGNRTLEEFNTKKKSGRIISEYNGKELVGTSIIYMNGRIYVFGGLDPIEPNKFVVCFDLETEKWEQIKPCNSSSFSLPICPLLCPYGEEEVLILGGYFMHSGQSYNNSNIFSFSLKNKYFSPVGKGEMIYPVLSSGESCLTKNNTVYCLCQLKRERHRHGPNFPALLTYALKDDQVGVQHLGM